MTDILVPLLIVTVLSVSVVRRREIFAPFVKGAKQGLSSTVNLLPTLVGLLVGVYMLRASGALDILAGLLTPIASAVGIEPSLIPLMLLKPLSGSGSLALGTDIIGTYGADSTVGRTAATVLAAGETTLYTVAVYMGAAGVKKSGRVLTASLIAELFAFITAVMWVKFGV